MLIGQFELRTSSIADGFPKLQEVVQVPLQFVLRATDTGRTSDDGHTGRQAQTIHRFAQFLTLFTFDTTGNTAATGIVGHQNEVTTGQRDKGRERCTLVAAFFLFHLNDEFLTFDQGFTDIGRTNVDAFLEVLTRDFLKGQETVAFFTVVHEASFQTRFNTRDDALVDIRLALFTAGRFDIDIDQLLAVNDADARFFGVRGIE